jgi:hypothetical protein
MELLEIKDSVSMSELTGADIDDMEKIINGKIRDALVSKIEMALEKMAFVDIEENEETTSYDITASLILCSTSDMSTSMQMIAQKLASYDLDEDVIEDILSTFTETKKGF